VRRTPQFSIVIPTYERRDTVVRMVAALERQAFDDFEVIVVVDGSSDGTGAALCRLQLPFPLAVLERENEGAAAARNAGAAAATGELLLFLDDDMEAHPEMLAAHDRSHSEGADIVLGHLPLHRASRATVLSRGAGTWAERRCRRLVSLASEVPGEELITGQMSIRKTVFERLGRFDVSFTRGGLFGGEDRDFGYRAVEAGLRIVFNPAAISYQLYEVDPAAYTRRSQEAGRSAEELRAKHPEWNAEMPGAEVFTTRRSRAVFGALAAAPSFLSWPLRALAIQLVRSGRLDARTHRLFFAVQTMEYCRGSRHARRKVGAGGAIVLAYHSISDLRGDPVLAEYGVRRSRFAEHLDALTGHGRQFITLRALLAALNGEQSLPAGAVLVTFDDAYADLLTAASPVLAERRIPAVAFPVAGHLGGTNEWDRPLGARSLALLDGDGLRAVAAHGVAIGSHGVTHRPLVSLDASELEHELRDSASALFSLGLPRPIAFAYPHGLWNHDVAAGVRDAGYSIAFTVQAGVVRGSTNRYGVPRIEVMASDGPLMLRLKLATAAWPGPWRRRLLRLLGAKL
jgi:glycosyltransferase involved in cell wall biosynthesis/peptidoglycan/xylan/chitin deacetylase (PgdA/CDA1 family)